MGQVTQEQVTLMLRLYELRREPRLRQAREWFITKFTATTPEELEQQCPPGSEANTSMRMTVSYWDMCANIVNRGLIDEEFFFEQGNEQFLVWERIKPTVPAFRSRFKNPYMLANLEEHCKRLEAWAEKRAPGSLEVIRKMFQQMARPAAQAAAD